MRLPVAVSLESRDGTLSKDAKIVNGMIEVVGEESRVRKRPGNVDLGIIKAGPAQILYAWNGLWTVQDDFLNSGTLTTIVSGSRTSTNLSPTHADLQFSAQDTSPDAATPRLMIKNRKQAWTVNRAGTAAAVTYGGNMGDYTYAVKSITRSGTVATVTTAEDTGFVVSDTVTIAGAGEAAYNGAQAVTAVTLGSFTPARDIPITITRSGTTATATSSTAHGLSTSTRTVSGANQSEYNGAKAITVTSTTAFTYTVTVTPASTVTWNPADKAATVTLSGANLTASVALSDIACGMVRGTTGRSVGKFYFEVTIGSCSSSAMVLYGLLDGTHTLTAQPSGATANGREGASPVGTVYGIAANLDSGSVQIYRNGAFQTYGATTAGTTYYPMFGMTGLGTAGSPHSAAATVNFGATAFAQTIPSGFAAWQSDSPQSPATGTIIVTDPAVTVDPTFTYTVAGSPATPATGTITAAITTGGTVPGIPFINGYFCVMDYNGVIWNSDPDDPTTWGALNFTTALFVNGRGAALNQSGGYLIAFKEWSTEYFFDASNPTGSPFSPVDNGFTQVGCASGDSVVNVEGALLWVSQSRQNGRGVHMMIGLEQQKVSTPDVDRILAADTLGTVYALGLNLDGHALYVLTLKDSNITIVYDLAAKAWYQWTSYTISAGSYTVAHMARSGSVVTITELQNTAVYSAGDPIKISGADQTEYNRIFQVIAGASAANPVTHIDTEPTTPSTGTEVAYTYTESYFKFTKSVSFDGLQLLLHESDGHLHSIDPEKYQDAGVPINFMLRTKRLGDGSRASMKRLGIVGDRTDDVCVVRWSDDDCTTFKAFRFVELEKVRPEARRCGGFERRTMELRHVGNTPVTIDAIEVEVQ